MSMLLFAWHALSPLALLAAAGGVGILAVAAFGLVLLPRWLVRPAIVAGAVLLAGSALWETAVIRTMAADERRAAAASLAAETARAETAEAITREQAASRARDRADLAAMTRRLEELNRDVQTRADRDRVCLPRDLARRLRAL